MWIKVYQETLDSLLTCLKIWSNHESGSEKNHFLFCFFIRSEMSIFPENLHKGTYFWRNLNKNFVNKYTLTEVRFFFGTAYNVEWHQSFHVHEWRSNFSHFVRSEDFNLFPFRWGYISSLDSKFYKLSTFPCLGKNDGKFLKHSLFGRLQIYGSLKSCWKTSKKWLFTNGFYQVSKLWVYQNEEEKKIGLKESVTSFFYE